MGEIKFFENPEFGQIRTMVMPDGQIRFVGKDVATVLGYSNSRDALRKHVDPEDKTDGVAIRDAIGREQKVTLINESGLYSLILSSKLPNARRFKHWVTAEVLPQIRRTGGYASPVIMQPHEMMAMMQKPETVMVLCKTIVDLDGKVQELLPKAEYAEHVLLSPTCYTMTEVAKSLSMTVQELQHRLHDMNIIYRAPSGCWMLYAPYLKCGYESYRTKSGANLFGETIWTDTYMVWTERGKQFIHSIFNQGCRSLNDVGFSNFFSATGTDPVAEDSPTFFDLRQ